MTLALQLLFLGAITFVQQDIADLGVELEPDAGALAFTYRLADLDGNGQIDLVLPNRIYFQNNGAFSSATSTICPKGPDQMYCCDLWKDAFYLRSESRLQIVRWNGKEWKTELDQPLAWPSAGSQILVSVHEQGRNALRFERFLHDVNGDGTPEIVVPDEHGLIIFAKGASQYDEAARLDVFPPLRLKPANEQQLWPEAERAVAFPAREMSCRYNLDGGHLSVISREDSPSADGLLARYRVKNYVLDTAASFKIRDDQSSEQVTEPFAPHLEALRLNEDGQIDIGGGDWQFSKSSTLPIPIYETKVSTDGGRTFKTVRVNGFKPQQSFVDFNHDGRLDLVTETTGLFDGGVREAVSRFCTGRDVRQTVQIRLQDETGKFSDAPDIQGAVNIELDLPPVRNGLMFARYQAGDLCSVAGNFGGDSNNDLLVQDHPNQVSLYLSTPKGFQSTPAAAIVVENVHRFSVADFNGDGLDDVAFHWYDVEQGVTMLKTMLFLTRQEAAQ